MESPRQPQAPAVYNQQLPLPSNFNDWHNTRPQHQQQMPPLLRAHSYDAPRYGREEGNQLPSSSSNPYFHSYTTTHEPTPSYQLPPANAPNSSEWPSTSSAPRPRSNSPPTDHRQSQLVAPQPLRAYQPYIPLPAPTSSAIPLPSPNWSTGTPSPLLSSTHYLKSPIGHNNWQQPQQQQHGLGLGRSNDALSLGVDDRWSPQAYLKQHVPYASGGAVAGDRSAPTTQGEWNRLNPPRLPLSSLSNPSWSDSLQDSRAPVPWIRSAQVAAPKQSSLPLPSRPLTEERRFHEPATPFIGKLHHLLTQTQHAHLIRWSANGEAFIFRAEDPRLSKLFERIWRTGMVKSFVRQLNIYSFDRAPATLASSWAAGSALSRAHLLSGYPSPASSLPSPNLPSSNSPPPADDGVGPWTGFSHSLFRRETTTSGLSAIKPIAVKKRAREMEEEQRALQRAVEDVTAGGEHKRMRSVE